MPAISYKATVFLTLLACSGLSQGEDERLVFGRSEKVFIPELNVTYTAKIDTGAESASLNGINVDMEGEPGEGGEVHFDLVLPDGELREVTLPLYDTVRIKKRAAASSSDSDDDKYTERASLKLTLCIGTHAHEVEVNLADRRRFSTDMLVGAKAITKFGALVDASDKYLQDDPRCNDVEGKEDH